MPADRPVLRDRGARKLRAYLIDAAVGVRIWVGCGRGRFAGH
jgi:hypothetical protein